MAFEGAGHLPNNREGETRRTSSPAPSTARSDAADARPLSRPRCACPIAIAGMNRPAAVVVDRLHPPAYRYFQPERDRNVGGVLRRDHGPGRGPSNRGAALRRPQPLRGTWSRTSLRGHARGRRDVAHRRARPGRDGGGHGGLRLFRPRRQGRDAVIGRFADGSLREGAWDELSRGTCMVGGHRRHRHRLLRPPVGVERDRVRRPRVSARVHAAGPNQREPWEGAEARELVGDFQDDVESDPGMAP